MKRSRMKPRKTWMKRAPFKRRTPLDYQTKEKPKRKGLAKKSTRKIQHNAEASPARDSYRERFLDCQYYRCRELATDLHEIVCGGLKEQAELERSLWLRLCSVHHNELQGLNSDDKYPCQLAHKFLADPDYYDPQVVRDVVNGDRPNPGMIFFELDVAKWLVDLKAA